MRWNICSLEGSRLNPHHLFILNLRHLMCTKQKRFGERYQGSIIAATFGNCTRRYDAELHSDAAYCFNLNPQVSRPRLLVFLCFRRVERCVGWWWSVQKP